MIQKQNVTRIVRKSAPALMAAVMAIGFLASAPRAHAQASLLWTNGSDNWTSATAWQTNLLTGTDPVGLTGVTCVAVASNVTAWCAGGGLASYPGLPDTAQFTNTTNPYITVNSSTYLDTVQFLSNAVVTIDASGNTLTPTNRFFIANSVYTTATVYWAGGTLACTNGYTGLGLGVGTGIINIGSGTNSVGTLVVTNGTVIYDRGDSTSLRGLRVGGSQSSGKLVISGPNSVVTNHTGIHSRILLNGGIGAFAGLRSAIIVTNGGKLFVHGPPGANDGGIIAGQAGDLIVSDPGSLVSIIATGITYRISTDPASRLVISNGATFLADGGGLGPFDIGRLSSYNTGVVVGAGSKLIVKNLRLNIGAGASGGNNNLTVYDGGYIEAGGTNGNIQVGQAATGLPAGSFNMGGRGAMSTGVVNEIRNNSTAQGAVVNVSNAVLICNEVNLQGANGGIALNVLAKGSLISSLSNGNFLSIDNSVLGNNAITVNAGTINAVSGSNRVNIAIGDTGTILGSSTPITMTIINGGKLLSESVSIGPSSSFNTILVTGAGSVWSNSSGGGLYAGTNDIKVGSGGMDSNGVFSSQNSLRIENGATLFNDGTLNIGNSPTSTVNSVIFGSPGFGVTIINSGEINVGNSSNTYGNSLTIDNASVTCSALHVGNGEYRTNNSLAFNNGTLSVTTELRIGNTNTMVYTGGTLLFQTLRVDGSMSGAATVNVPTSSTLQGIGSVANPVTVANGGILAPGNGVGTLTISNNLVLNSAATLAYALGTNSDLTVVTGNLTLDGTVDVNDSGGLANANYTLISYGGTLINNTLTVGTMPAGFSGTISNDTVGKLVVLDVDIVASDPYGTWLTTYGLTPGGNGLGTADPDGDGMSNTNEFLAGFNPTNSTARLTITSVGKVDVTNTTIAYLGASGDSSGSLGPKTNVLDVTAGTPPSYTNNWVDAGQTNVLSGGLGLGQSATFVHTNGATGPARYYRVRVLVP